MSYNRRSKHRHSHDNNNERQQNRNERPKVTVKSKRPSNVTVYARPGENPERAIKRFLKKCKKVKIVEEYRKRQYFEKPSTIKRREKIRRKRVLEKAQREAT